jgi:putative ABC transport system substrate-binding protein
MSARTEAFRQGLRELGYVEGRTIVIEWRSAEGQLDRLPSLAAELVRLKVDVIVTGGPSATRPTKAATGTIPIVITNDSDPVANGFVASLARPGGNITGLSTVSPEMYGKQLELLQEIIPGLSRVAVLGDSAEPGHAQALREAERAARTLRVQLQYLDVRGPNDIEPAFRAARTGRADAVLTLTSAVLASHRTQVVDLTGRSRLPAMHFFPGFVTDGGLMSYGASTSDLDRRAATYVDRILKGAKPADLPVRPIGHQTAGVDHEFPLEVHRRQQVFGRELNKKSPMSEGERRCQDDEGLSVILACLGKRGHEIVRPLHL